MSAKIAFHDSSGSVFADLKISNPEEYLAKAELAARILKVIQGRRLTQTAAAGLLGISQPKISALLNGRLDGFSTDRLFRFLNDLLIDPRVSASIRKGLKTPIAKCKSELRW
jgi:predicted XRE-type DNA-binding protein